MKIFETIKLLWANRKALKPVGEAVKNIQEVSKMKAGWKTSEFWLTVVTNLLVIAEALKGNLNPNTAAVIVAVLNGAYGVLRTLAKTS